MKLRVMAQIIQLYGISLYLYECEKGVRVILELN